MDIETVIGLVIFIGLYAFIVLKYNTAQRTRLEELYKDCLRKERDDEDRYND